MASHLTDQEKRRHEQDPTGIPTLRPLQSMTPANWARHFRQTCASITSETETDHAIAGICATQGVSFTA